MPHTNSGGTTENIFWGKNSQAYHQRELTPESRKYTQLTLIWGSTTNTSA